MWYCIIPQLLHYVILFYYILYYVITILTWIIIYNYSLYLVVLRCPSTQPLFPAPPGDPYMMKYVIPPACPGSALWSSTS